MAVKSRYRLLHGTHVDRGTVFKAGDQIEDESDLVARFPGKFVKEAVLVEREVVKAAAPVAPPPPPAKAAPVDPPEPADDEDEAADETEEGAEAGKSDVTGDFPEAAGKEVTVWSSEEGGYTVVKGKATLFTGATPRQVKKFLKTLE